MKHAGKTIVNGVTFLKKDDPNKVRYTVENVYPNRSLDYTTENAFLKRRAGESHRAVSRKVSFGNFINHVFGEWVESLDEKENAEREALASMHALQEEVNGDYDEAVVLDALFDVSRGKDAAESALRILDLLAINTTTSRKAGEDDGYDAGYDAGYDNGYGTAIDLTTED